MVDGPILPSDNSRSESQLGAFYFRIFTAGIAFQAVREDSLGLLPRWQLCAHLHSIPAFQFDRGSRFVGDSTQLCDSLRSAFLEVLAKALSTL